MPATLSIILGLLWGMLGSYVLKQAMGPWVWVAALAGPFIGLLVYWASRRVYARPFWVLIPLALVSTVVGVALFGLAVGLVDLFREIPDRRTWAVVVQGMNICLWGLFFQPAFWVLFPLAFGNHALVRHFTR